MSRFQEALRPVGVIGGIRLPFCRVGTEYRDQTSLELMTATLKALVQKYFLRDEVLGDVALGAALMNPKIWNFAREAVLLSGLSAKTPAVNIQRACGTSLETTIDIAYKIASGQIQAGIAGGWDSMSDVPLFLKRKMAKRFLKMSRGKNMSQKVFPWLGWTPLELLPDAPSITEMKTGLSMGEHCELMAQEWKISRKEQDEFALISHQRAHQAYEDGFYDDLVNPYIGANRDNNVRANSNLEKLAKLSPAFEKSAKGTLTAGNSSPLTDGASCVLLASEEWAREKNLEIQAFIDECEVAAVDFTHEGLLMAPAYAMAKMLNRAATPLSDFDFYEIHEAFAAQVLCTLKAWEDENFCKEHLGLHAPLGSIDRNKLNMKGGSVALGHPFGATGARIVATLAKMLHEKGSGKGLISICTGGGMGVTAILKR